MIDGFRWASTDQVCQFEVSTKDSRRNITATATRNKDLEALVARFTLCEVLSDELQNTAAVKAVRHRDRHCVGRTVHL